MYQGNDGRLLANIHNSNQLIEQHHVSISDDEELSQAEQLYRLRVNDPELVATNFINIHDQEEMCSKSYSGSIFT